MKLIDILNEGPRDPNIFKVIFTAGIPGSGKTTIVNKLIAGTGMRTVNFDELYEYLLKNQSDHVSPIEKSTNLLDKKMSMYIDGRLGIVVDKTAWDYDKVKDIKNELENIGYDALMVYVNTSIDIAKDRVIKRAQQTGRRVDPEYIDRVFVKLNQSLGKYQEDFSDRFVIVDNTHEAVENRSLKFARRKVDAFLRAKPANRTAIKWIQSTP